MKIRKYYINGKQHKLYNRLSIAKTRHTLCEEWEASSDDFVEWCLNNNWGADSIISVIDKTKPYGPDNLVINNPISDEKRDAIMRRMIPVIAE